MSAIPERPVQCYSDVFGLGEKGQGFVVEPDFQLNSLLLRWKTADAVFIVLNLNIQVWRYLPTVSMSLL